MNEKMDLYVSFSLNKKNLKQKNDKKHARIAADCERRFVAFEIKKSISNNQSISKEN